MKEDFSLMRQRVRKESCFVRIAGEKRNGTTYLCLVDQPFVLEIDRSGVAAELKQLFDVVLYLEYIASF